MTINDRTRSTQYRRLPANVHVPAWLRDVPDALITPDTRDGSLLTVHSSQRLLRYLANRGLPRPTLLQLEAERLRRAIRGPSRAG